MNFNIQMPPSTDRDLLVEAFSKSIESDSDYSSLRAVMARLISNGQDSLGIACLLLQISTIKLIRAKLLKKGNSTNMNAAFGHPISLN